MKKVNLLTYLFSCFFIIYTLLALTEWVIFIDQLSFLTVIIPTIAAFYIRKDISIDKRLAISLKTTWISGGLMFIYGIILTLSNVGDDFRTIFAGLAVSLIPIFYCFIISLICVPYLYLIEEKIDQDT